MSAAVPQDPPVFHITHVKNLPGILAEEGLWCDAERLARNLITTNIAYSHIKQRRMRRAVPAAAGGTLADYVPFNFCPRSVMLYPIARGHVDYQGGQDSVLHLVSRLSRVQAAGGTFAFTDRHAYLAHALYFDDVADLHHVPWHVMNARQWQAVKEERQAELLVHRFVPWTAVIGIGVRSEEVAEQVRQILRGQVHIPGVKVQPSWYY